MNLQLTAFWTLVLVFQVDFSSIIDYSKQIIKDNNFEEGMKYGRNEETTGSQKCAIVLVGSMSYLTLASSPLLRPQQTSTLFVMLQTFSFLFLAEQIWENYLLNKSLFGWQNQITQVSLLAHYSMYPYSVLMGWELVLCL